MFTFDYNGNILTQQRYEGSTLVDNLSYQYATNSAGHLLSNRLYSVDDSVTVASLSAKDMEDMPAYNNTSPNASNNYTYTQIGELKSDNQEEIQEIVWRVDSKISEITRTNGSAKKNLKFEYDAMGNRVAKHVYAGSVLESSTYYVRDAQGNVMGVYEHKMDAANAVMEYKLIERNIYGSAQVGICKDTVDLNITNSSGALTQATYYHARQLNHRQYSLSNHLGNVLTTIGDGKAPVDSNSDGVIDYFTAYIISVSDYSPFGVELANRTWSIEEYRSGFNGKEKVNEITGNSSDYDFGARIYDARIGRWMSVDALYYNHPNISSYTLSANSPIYLMDFDGNDYIVYINHNEKKITIKQTFYAIEGKDADEAGESAKYWENSMEKFQYQFTNDKGEIVNYKIAYEYEIIPAKDYDERDTKYYEDKSGKANTYTIVQDGQLEGDYGRTENVPALDRGSSVIKVEPNFQRKRKTGSHEIGHTLGLLHWAKGLMKSGRSRPDSEVSITLGNVSKVLNRLNIGKPNKSGNLDYQKESGDSEAKGKVTLDGDAPVGFESGKVVSK